MVVTDEQLLHAFAAPAAALGVELDDVELNKGILLVTVDRPGGLDLEAVAEVARALSEFLDEHDELAPEERYELEVSSPGLERKLRRPEQFVRALGERVNLKTRPGVSGDRRLEGVLREAGDEGFTLELDGAELRRLAYSEVDRARTVFDWQAALSERRATEKAAAEGAEDAAKPAGSAKRAKTGNAKKAGTSAEAKASGEKKQQTRERATRS
ncbi:MAG: hypothetical protein JWM85_3176 [Acidimicrobiaceae bacterium]|nr:hypothetical protein [Acidimicrobiaceae bacterium]